MYTTCDLDRLSLKEQSFSPGAIIIIFFFAHLAAGGLGWGRWVYLRGGTAHCSLSTQLRRRCLSRGWQGSVSGSSFGGGGGQSSREAQLTHQHSPVPSSSSDDDRRDGDSTFSQHPATSSSFAAISILHLLRGSNSSSRLKTEWIPQNTTFCPCRCRLEGADERGASSFCPGWASCCGDAGFKS